MNTTKRESVAIMPTNSTRNRRSTVKRWGAFAIAGALAAGALAGSSLAVSASAATTGYSVTSSTSSVVVGSQVAVAVKATKVTDLYAYTLTLTYNPKVLTYVKGSASTSISGKTYETVSAGSVTITHTKLGSSPAASGDLTLANVKFTSTGVGTSAVIGSKLVSVTSGKVSTTVQTLGSASVRVAAKAVAKVKSHTTVALVTKKPKAGQKVRIKIVVKARGTVPTGKVKVTYAGKTVRSAATLKKGTVKVTLPAKAKGKKKIKVTYQGSAKVKKSTATKTIRVK